MSWSECAACKRVFSSVSGFDAHRTGSYDDRSCLDPAALGMHRNQYGRWAFPGDAYSGARDRNLRASEDQGGVM
jgi:hypothetical protein